VAVRTENFSSAALASASYDDETQTLSVTFTSGQTYALRSVPPEIAQGLFDAPSPGSYWHSVLKGNY
jgi:KTSC domain